MEDDLPIGQPPPQGQQPARPRPITRVVSYDLPRICSGNVAPAHQKVACPCCTLVMKRENMIGHVQHKHKGVEAMQRAPTGSIFLMEKAALGLQAAAEAAAARKRQRLGDSGTHV